MACSGNNDQRANTPATCTSSKASQTDWRYLQPCRMDQIVAVCAGLRYSEIDPGWFASVTLWPDGDEKALETARQQAQQWANRGYTVPIKLLPKGEDPASMNWRTP